MTDWTEDEEGWAHHGWARGPKHSTVTRLAPTAETAVTITCGRRRVLARVWPRGAPPDKQFVVTTSGMLPLVDEQWPAIPAPCACALTAHVLDRRKLLVVVQQTQTRSAARQPEVDVSGVARDKPNTDT